MKKTYLLLLIILLATVLFGGFYEFVSCILTIILSLYLIVDVIKNQSFRLVVSHGFLFSVILVVGSLISVIFSADRGMAFLGCLKWLPLLLFSITLMQMDDTDVLVEHVSILTVIILGISCLGYLIFPLHDAFIMTDRLGGTFQYANTMALFLLIGIVIEQFSYHTILRSGIISAALLFGILLTGSRTVFVFTIIILFISMIHDHQYIKVNLCMLILSAILGITYAEYSGNFQNIGRFLTISVSSSTLLGRLLYWQDALKLIITHPFGLGYMGYSYVQGQVQTGVYTTLFVHNEFLQLLLDFGWIPAILIVGILIYQLCFRQNSFRNRILCILILVHSFVDFDFQFISIGLIFLLVLDQTAIYKKSYTITPKVISGLCTLMIGINCYFVIPLLFQYHDYSQLALKFYPVYTEAEKQLMLTSTSEETAVEYANKIINQNSYVYQAYDVLATSYVIHGDYDQMIVYKKDAIKNNPYSIEEYTDYISLLSQAISDSYAKEDSEAMRRYINEALNVKTMLKDLEHRTSSLGWKIQDVPQTKLPEEYDEYLEMLEEISQDK